MQHFVSLLMRIKNFIGHLKTGGNLSRKLFLNFINDDATTFSIMTLTLMVTFNINATQDNVWLSFTCFIVMVIVVMVIVSFLLLFLSIVMLSVVMLSVKTECPLS
jgi:hypothetical protein